MFIRILRTVIVIVACVLASGVALAQSAVKAEGWPAAPQPLAGPVPAPVPHAQSSAVSMPRVRPAARPVRVEASTEAGAASTRPAPVGPTTPRPSAPALVASAVSPSSVNAPAAVITAATAVDVMRTLQEQSVALRQLASELEQQRTVIEEQQRTIQLLTQKPAAMAAPAAAPAVAPVAPAPPPPPSIVVDAAGVKLKMGGLVQSWYSASSGPVIDTFRIRRAELKVSGDIAQRGRWTVMLDPVKTTAPLQDAFVALPVSPIVGIELGQQKIPLSFEGTQSSGRLDTVERALFITDKARGAGYGDVRDLGVIARGKTVAGQLEYAAGIFNGLGESINDTDKNEEKAFVGRAVVRAKRLSGIQFGGSMARGTLRGSELTQRSRQGLEMSVARGLFAARSELMFGSDGPITRRGYYTQGLARVAKPFDALFRVDSWDPDTRDESTAATVAERDWLGGLNWRVSGQTVLMQVNYVRKTFADVQAPRNVLLANLQTTW